jgi:hypothetical protein
MVPPRTPPIDSRPRADELLPSVLIERQIQLEPANRDGSASPSCGTVEPLSGAKQVGFSLALGATRVRH